MKIHRPIRRFIKPLLNFKSDCLLLRFYFFFFFILTLYSLLKVFKSHHNDTRTIFFLVFVCAGNSFYHTPIVNRILQVSVHFYRFDQCKSAKCHFQCYSIQTLSTNRHLEDLPKIKITLPQQQMLEQIKINLHFLMRRRKKNNAVDGGIYVSDTILPRCN